MPPVWRELRGIDAGYDVPQFSIHRGKLHGVLTQAVLERIGTGRVHTGCVLSGFEVHGDAVVASFQGRETRGLLTVAGDALVGCDGIHSTVRRLLYPGEGPPVWNGLMLWRGATEWETLEDGRERVIDAVEARAPDGFTDIDAVLPYRAREAIVRGYAGLAGYAIRQVDNG
jgi:5-methylphenazine-1-carboxylate 1-monooxygenase